MKTKSKLIKVGFVVKSHGLKGELFVSSLHSKPEWPSDLKSLKVGESEFLVERCSPHKKGFLLKLKACDSKEQAEQLRSKSVFIDKNLFQSKGDDSFYLMELLGFSVEIEGQEGQGSVLCFESDAKNQDFLVIEFSVKKGMALKYSVPLVKAYLKKIDFQKKQIVLDLPKDFLTFFKSNNTYEE